MRGSIRPILTWVLLGVWLCLAQGAEAAPPNVVLLSVDTLRADHLGCYGYKKATSPNLDRFAEGALLFEDAVCEVPLTAPSFGAMLTSRPPRLNGTTRNGLRLPEGLQTATQIFQAAGFQTFGVQSNWTAKAKLSGIERGFDEYDDDFHEKRWGLIKPERSGGEVTRLALEYLAKRDPAKPFFAWFHYSDPHAPYVKHAGFDVWGKPLWQLNKVDKVRAKYDSEIAFVDAEIAKVLAALPENTAVLFVADHGESLYEHDYLGHGRRIYQNNMHIPFILRAPGVAPGRSAAPVRGIDVGPTLLGLAGLAPADTMLGLNVLSATIPEDRARIVETYGGAVPKLPGAKAVMGDRGPIRQGVLLQGWKLIIDGKREELYHLPKDPGELKNLAKTEPGKVKELRAQIDAWELAHPHADEKETVLSEDDKAALEAFGYLK